jgi:hypothetical protein
VHDGGGLPTRQRRGRTAKGRWYERNYGLLQTFEPFRQGGRDFALISPQYTGTSVLDLATGHVIAEEPISSTGFPPEKSRARS